MIATGDGCTCGSHMLTNADINAVDQAGQILAQLTQCRSNCRRIADRAGSGERSTDFCVRLVARAPFPLPNNDSIAMYTATRRKFLIYLFVGIS
jgi:hypothetical protein